MLIGSHEHNIDPKGRLFIPAKWREDLGETFIITRGMCGSFLIGMPLSEWEAISLKLAAIPYTNKAAQEASRAIHAMTVQAELDKQGRVLIGQKHRDYAKLESDIVLIGKSNHIEIWNAADLCLDDEQSFHAALDQVDGFNI